MSTHVSANFREDDDGFITPRCVCGWSFGPVPDLETAIDVLMEHAAEVALQEDPAR